MTDDTTQWTTECAYCDESIEVDDPSEVTQLGGEPYHDDCVDDYWEDFDPDLPTYVDIELKNEPEGYAPHWVRDLYDPFTVEVGRTDSDDPTTVSANMVPREVWNLGHLTRVTFCIDEDWNIEVVAVDGKRVTDEKFRTYEHEP